MPDHHHRGARDAHRHHRHHPIEAMPQHLQYNKFVLHGYRPHGPEHGVRAALLSLFYWHNETLNIMTHLLGAIICAYWLVFTDPSEAALPHYSLVRLADTASLVCFLGSFNYHTFMSATPTRREYTTLLAADLAAVAFAGLGANVALGWLSLPCQPLSVIFGVCVIPSVLAVIWAIGFARTAAERVLGPGLQLLTRVAVILYGATTGAGYWPLPFLVGHLGTEVSNLVGGLLGATRIPERWYQGSLTAYVFQSHTLMHCTALFGMLFQHFLLTWRCEALARDAATLACADANAAALYLS